MLEYLYNIKGFINFIRKISKINCFLRKKVGFFLILWLIVLYYEINVYLWLLNKIIFEVSFDILKKN